jgi:hypothetical protein
MVIRLGFPKHAARCRQTRLHSQRGAAVFIVVMVLTLLTAVGIFAVRSASLADVAAGYDREAAQASLVADYATTAAAAYLATQSTDTILANMNPPSLYCQSNANALNLKMPCFKMTTALIEQSTLAQGNENLFETSSSSLNVNGTTVADFIVELTDPGSNGVPKAGSQKSAIQVTVTAIAQVQEALACTTGAKTTWSAGEQETRALISAGGQ